MVSHSPVFLSQWLTDTFVAVYIAGAIASHSFRISAATVDAPSCSSDEERDGQAVPTNFKSRPQQELWHN